MRKSETLTLASLVDGRFSGLRLDAYLSQRFTYKSLEGWAGEIGAGRIRLNKKPARASDTVKAKDEVSWTFEHSEPDVPGDFNILYEDEFLLALDKPAGLPCHSQGVFITHTVANLLKKKRPGEETCLAHRLDRETSGVLVAAKDKTVLTFIMKQFETHQAEKAYLAVVRGVPVEDSFVVDKAIGRDTQSSISVRQKAYAEPGPDARPAKTAFTVIERLNGFALVEARPMSGRLNQIRVHLEHAGFPVVGDKLYGRPDEDYLAFVTHVKAGGDPSFHSRFGSARHLLHASRLTLTHPVKEQKLVIEAPMPGDMREFVEKNKT